MKHVKDSKREQRRIEKVLRKAKENQAVAVGVINDDPHSKGFSMVELAMVHEFGSKDGRIPGRSFIRTTFDEKESVHRDLLHRLQQKVLAGKIGAKQALTTVGEVVAKNMAETINDGIEPGLKESTKKRKGSSKPLIDTGRLKASVTHELRGGE